MAPIPKQLRFQYDVDGQRSRIERRGVTEDFATAISYWSDGLASSIVHATLNNGVTLAQYDYVCDNDRRLVDRALRMNKVDAGDEMILDEWGTTFAYDAAGQLTQAITAEKVGTDSTATYTNGRSSTSSTWDVGADNRLNADDNYTYDYDAEGRLVRRTAKSDNSYWRAPQNLIQEL